VDGQARDRTVPRDASAEQVARALQAGVMSSPASSALLCPECGAALGASDSDRCDHCHAQVATGAHAWVLAGVVAG
jgi:hypothetical protein